MIPFTDANDFSVDAFISQFKGGVRSSLFIWEPMLLDSEGNTLIDESRNIKFFVKSASFPSTNLEENIVEYQGLNFKTGGRKTYEDWTVTVLLDKKGKIRYELEDWTNGIHEVNEGKSIYHYFDNYKSTQRFKILSSDGKFDNPIAEIELHNAWPKSIGPISLDYGSNDFAQFDLTFSYQYHKIVEVTVSDTELFNLESFLSSVEDKVKILINI